MSKIGVFLLSTINVNTRQKKIHIHSIVGKYNTFIRSGSESKNIFNHTCGIFYFQAPTDSPESVKMGRNMFSFFYMFDGTRLVPI